MNLFKAAKRKNFSQKKNLNSVEFIIYTKSIKCMPFSQVKYFLF
jgi:hypothetical protein